MTCPQCQSTRVLPLLPVAIDDPPEYVCRRLSRPLATRPSNGAPTTEMCGAPRHRRINAPLQFAPMTYVLLASLQVGDTMQLSSASRSMNEVFRVIAIERDVDELGTPLPGLSHPPHDPDPGETRQLPRQGCAVAFFRH
jgi:hypothetical protein